MHTLPLNLAKNFNTNHIQNLSFKASFALPSSIFSKDEKKDTLNISKRYEEIKKINPEKTSIIGLMRLNDEEYTAVMNMIYKFPKREMALLDKESKLGFSKEKDTFNGITDKKLGLSFSNGYGFHSVVNTSNDYGDLHTSRESSYLQGKSTMNFVDKSRFNEDYYVENSYSETMDNSHDYKTTKTRNISIRGSKLYPILDYSYSKKYFQNSDYSEYSINGRRYKAKINKDGKVTISSGSKWETLNFSKAAELLSGTESEKDSFVEALKLLPPQMLLELNDTINSLMRDNKRLCLYTPATAANSIIDITIERLAEKNGLTKDKQLNKIFKEEKENFIKWLKEDSDGRIRKDAQSYMKNHLEPEKELPEVIKSVCSLLWMEEYDENKADDEGKRLLLNFFPETVSYIVSAFELNAVSRKTSSRSPVSDAAAA